MKINGRDVPQELRTYFFMHVIIALVGFSIMFPLMAYVIKPLILLVSFGTPLSVSFAYALSFSKMCKLILFLSVAVPFILLVREFISWYRKLGPYSEKNDF